MVTGESGTGKELVARALHDRGKRKAGPFVAVNCAALTETLLESELFGHTKGAFTDAKTAHAGLFTQSNGGTLFLDEIGEMSPAMQAKLLRSLETRSVRPVGATADIPFDARIIAATNRDLETMVEEGGFRVDLFYRLNVLRLSMPPLRARGNDVLLIAQHFINRQALQTGKPFTGLTPAAAERLLTYAWPGNVRELQNCIERAVAVTRTDQIGEEALPERIRHHRAISLGTEDDVADLPSMAEVERDHIVRVLEKTGGNKTAAAEILGFDRRTLYRKLEHFGLLKAGA